MSTWNIFQQVFGLSMISNSNNNARGPLDQLQKEMEQALAKYKSEYGLNSWNTAWGPVVRQTADSDGPDNTWFVVHNSSATFEDGKQYNTYVVAMAGTATPYDWENEDMGVGEVVDFNAWVKQGIQTTPRIASKPLYLGSPFIARGTADATYALVTQPAPASAIGAGASLYQYLSKIPQADPGTLPLRIVFTGHSLGGALSPTLALTLKRGGGIPSFSAGNAVLTFPTAGPTPGNPVFYGDFIKVFPPYTVPNTSPYQAWNMNTANRSDIVPQAWCTDRGVSATQNLSNIATLWGKLPWPLDVEIALAVDALVLLAKESGIGSYAPLSASLFTSPISPTIPKNMEQFEEEARTQHVDAYFKLFGINMPTVLAAVKQSLEMVNKATGRISVLGLLVKGEEDEKRKD